MDAVPLEVSLDEIVNLLEAVGAVQLVPIGLGNKLFRASLSAAARGLRGWLLLRLRVLHLARGGELLVNLLLKRQQQTLGRRGLALLGECLDGLNRRLQRLLRVSLPLHGDVVGALLGQGKAVVLLVCQRADLGGLGGGAALGHRVSRSAEVCEDGVDGKIDDREDKAGAEGRVADGEEHVLDIVGEAARQIVNNDAGARVTLAEAVANGAGEGLRGELRLRLGLLRREEGFGLLGLGELRVDGGRRGGGGSGREQLLLPDGAEGGALGAVELHREVNDRFNRKGQQVVHLRESLRVGCFSRKRRPNDEDDGGLDRVKSLLLSAHLRKVRRAEVGRRALWVSAAGHPRELVADGQKVHRRVPLVRLEELAIVRLHQNIRQRRADFAGREEQHVVREALGRVAEDLLLD